MFMEERSLQNTLGDAQIDAVVGEVIRVYEGVFPGQIAGYYVEGSYADRTHLATSDIDLVLVFRQPFADEEERKVAEQAWDRYNKGSTLEVDLVLTNEQDRHNGVHPNVKLGNLFLYGEDVCRRYPIVPIESWTSERMYVSGSVRTENGENRENVVAVSRPSFLPMKPPVSALATLPIAGERSHVAHVRRQVASWWCESGKTDVLHHKLYRNALQMWRFQIHA